MKKTENTHFNRIVFIIGFTMLSLVNSSLFAQLVTTYAGNGQYGYLDGLASEAEFYSPYGVAVDTTNGDVFVADWSNNVIRKITYNGIVSTFAGSGEGETIDGQGTAAAFDGPNGITIDVNRNLYVTERYGHCIRKITPSGMVTTVAGGMYVGNSDGPAATAAFDWPRDVAVATDGTIYVTDFNNHNIRKISTDGMVSTLAGGNGSNQYGSVDGVGSAARFHKPTGIAIDAEGNLFVVEVINHKVRKITPDGVVTTFAGTGVQGETNGPNLTATFAQPQSIRIDVFDNIYVLEAVNRVRKIAPGGGVTTLAGHFSGFADGIGQDAKFYSPRGICVDNYGDLFVADMNNHRIRKITNNYASIENLSLNILEVYPNPAQNFVKISILGSQLEGIQLTDLNGKILSESKEKGAEAELNTSNLNSGVYLLNIQTSAGSVVKRFTKI